jgi:hypothetical protein
MPQAVMVGAMVAMGGMQLLSARGQSKAIKSQAEYESQQLTFNSKVADLQARDAELRGKKEATEHKTKVKTLIGSQRAALAAQGIDVGSGSALDLQTETAEFGALDAMTIRNNAFREATGYRIQSIDYAGQATMTRLAGKNAARNTMLAGGISALGSFAGAANAAGGTSTPKKTSGYTYKGYGSFKTAPYK